MGVSRNFKNLQGKADADAAEDGKAQVTAEQAQAIVEATKLDLKCDLPQFQTWLDNCIRNYTIRDYFQRRPTDKQTREKFAAISKKATALRDELGLDLRGTADELPDGLRYPWLQGAMFHTIYPGVDPADADNNPEMHKVTIDRLDECLAGISWLETIANALSAPEKNDGSGPSNPGDRAFAVFLRSLGGAYKDAFDRDPGISLQPQPGPFVRFMKAIVSLPAINDRRSEKALAEVYKSDVPKLESKNF